MKKTIVYIDHSFHKKTLSAFFLRDILSEDFEIVNFWDDSWKGGAHVSVEQINKLDCDYVLFFQVLPSIAELKQIKHKIIWVPMYDSCLLCSDSFWSELATVPIKIISFSKVLSDQMKKAGLSVLELKFYPPTKTGLAFDQPNVLKVFYWYRGPVKFGKVKKILSQMQMKTQLVIKNDPDPGFKKLRVSAREIKRFDIKLIEGYLEKKEYLKLVDESGVYIAPRNYEGIGMSFLESMAAGKLVISIDKPTMNEYIKHRKNGIFFGADINGLTRGEIVKISKSAAADNSTGYDKWKKQVEGITPFISGEYKIRKHSQIKIFFLSLIAVPVKICRIINYYWINSF